MSSKKTHTSPTFVKSEVKSETKVENTKVTEEPKVRPGSFASLISQ